MRTAEIIVAEIIGACRKINLRVKNRFIDRIPDRRNFYGPIQVCSRRLIGNIQIRESPESKVFFRSSIKVNRFAFRLNGSNRIFRGIRHIKSEILGKFLFRNILHGIILTVIQFFIEEYTDFQIYSITVIFDIFYRKRELKVFVSS